MTSIGMPELMVILTILVVSVVVIWPAARICQRAGFPFWLGVLTVVPIANIVLLWLVALADWPLARPAAR